MKKKNKKVAVGLSGGVDSSVALILLKKQGFEPIGVSLKYSTWPDKTNQLKENVCCSAKSFNQAKAVCQKLDIPYQIIDYSKEFKDKVIDYFSSLLKQKQTPNPCLICNRDLKFAKLFQWADENDVAYVATGHHARVRENKKTKLYELLRGRDKEKDQSYFLCLLDQAKLARLIFPVGEYLKQDIYEIAEKEGFGFYTKIKQSQDLCFISSKSMPFFLAKEIGLEKGSIKDVAGKVLGKHQGLHFYTIGQRKGLDIPNGPWWVIGLEIKNNTLIVSNKKDDAQMFHQTVIVNSPHFISGQLIQDKLDIKAKVRYNQLLKLATIYPPANKQLKLVFNKPQKAVTPGQWAVFYKKDVCLGGGIIISSNQDNN